MRVLLDTSVLVPALVRSHANFALSEPLLSRAQAGELELFLSQHSLAETYNTLTKYQFKPRLSPELAWTILHGNLKLFAEIVPLTPEDYRAVLERMAGLGIRGGAIYDALIAQAAQKINADRLVTFNVEDFRRVWPEGHDKITRP